MLATEVASLLVRFARSSPQKRKVIELELLRHFEPVLRWAWQSLRQKGSSVEFADFTEKVLADLFQAPQRLRSPSAFPYLLLNAVQRVFDKQTSIESSVVAASDFTIDEPWATVGRTTINATLVRTYLDRLPARAAQALEMEFVQGLKQEEILKRMSLTKSGLASTRRRGLQHLRVILLRKAKGLKV
jgi:DNA-directed RNA polymerase specialized sigma24 family protein